MIEELLDVLDEWGIKTSEVQAIKFDKIDEINKMREEKNLVNRDECYNALSEYLFRL